MADYNIAALESRSFEQLIQALAIREIANGITPFGDGPDGGREATYSGKMNYPSAAETWDGYLVVQCKFNARPSGDLQKDAAWLIKELKKDLEKFSDTSRNLPKPEYYLASTNIVLSPTAGSGGRDKVDALLHDLGNKLGFKGHDVWAYDNVCRYLDSHQDIRSAYPALRTFSDGLALTQANLDLFSGVNAPPNRMSTLIESFKREREKDEVFTGIVTKLKRYATSIDGTDSVKGLADKLERAGYQDLLHYAMIVKEQFVKKLTEFEFSKSAQQMQGVLLAEVFTRFHHSVWPLLTAGRSQQEVMAQVQAHVIEPVMNMLGENVLSMDADELSGILFYLTGNCHIRWTNS